MSLHITYTYYSVMVLSIFSFAFIGPNVIIFCWYQKRSSFSLGNSLSYPQTAITVSLSLEISIQLFFFPFLFSGFRSYYVWPFKMPLMSLDAAIFLFFILSFYCTSRIHASTHSHTTQCWWVFFLLLFLTLPICQCYHSAVRHCVLSSVFSIIILVFWVFLTPTSAMEFEWQQLSSSHLESSKYSGRS